MEKKIKNVEKCLDELLTHIALKMIKNYENSTRVCFGTLSAYTAKFALPDVTIK